VLRLWQLRFQFAQRLLRIPIAMLFLPLCRVRPLKTIMNWRQVPLVTGSATNFFGWLHNSGTPFTSLVIVPGAGSPDAFATVDDLVLGQAAPASVPGPLPLIGAATAFGFSRRLRSRIAAARPRA
jgi:hypothetical protein